MSTVNKNFLSLYYEEIEVQCVLTCATLQLNNVGVKKLSDALTKGNHASFALVTCLYTYLPTCIRTVEAACSVNRVMSDGINGVDCK